MILSRFRAWWRAPKDFAVRPVPIEPVTADKPRALKPRKPRPVFQSGDAVEVRCYPLAGDRPSGWRRGTVKTAWPGGMPGYQVTIGDETFDRVSPHDVRKPRKGKLK